MFDFKKSAMNSKNRTRESQARRPLPRKARAAILEAGGTASLGRGWEPGLRSAGAMLGGRGRPRPPRDWSPSARDLSGVRTTQKP